MARKPAKKATAKAKPTEAQQNVPENADEAEEAMEVDEAQNVDLTSSFARKEFDPNVYTPIEVPPAPDKVATYSVDGPRLMITHIENHFFKSYAGKTSLGPFNKCFTAIVGPNGSGKSNVIDSMLFVFGYRASKIRSKKISVLIHNSTKHPNVPSCTVTVYFQMIKDTGLGDEDYEVVDGTKFNVSRTAHRDNSSFYTMNGSRVTYKEVATLLRSKGIDLDHNRFLILQGEVEQIAMMKPKAMTEHDEGMLEFLEDIIGSNRFQQPIEILSKRLEELGEFRTEKMNRVKAVEKEKNGLEGPKNEAMRYLEMENDIMLRKNVLYNKYVQESNLDEEKAAVERDRIQESMSGVLEQLAQITQSREVQMKALKKSNIEYEKKTAECETLGAKFKDYEKRDVKCNEDLKHSALNRKKIEKNLQTEIKKVETLKTVPKESEKTIEEKKAELETLEGQKKVEEGKLTQVMDGLKNETKDLQAEKELKEGELLKLQKTVNETKSKYQVSQEELDLCLSNHQKETARLESLKSGLEKAATTLQAKQQQIKNLEKGITDSQTSLQKSKQDLKVVSDAKEKSSTKLQSLRSKVEVAKSAIDSVRSRGRVLDALMAQKNNGNIAGISGRLGDVGGIDDKYDVAVSTACGMLDHIICDTINTAQKCVEYLKSSGTGIASFIGLDKMAKWIPFTKKKITTPENVPRLFDLIKVQNPDYLPAFYFAVRDTLVAKDLDQATRIAYGKTRYRVVTLQGQLIDQSGTMSGGGKSVCKGRMGSSAVTVSEYTPAQLKSMEAELETVQHEAQQCVGNKDKLEDTVQQLDKDLNHMKQSLQKCQMDIKATTEQEKILRSQVKDQEAKVKAATPDEKEVKNLQNRVEVQKKDYDEAAGKAEKIETVVKSLHQKIMDYGSAKITPIQSKIDQISGQMDQATGQITKANVAVKTAERNLKKSEEKVKSLEQEQVDNAAKIEELKELYKTIETEAGDVMQKIEEVQEAIKAMDMELEKMNKEQAELEMKEDKLKKENIEVRNELEKFGGMVKEYQTRIKHWKRELGRLKLNKINRDDSEELPAVSNDELSAIDKEAAAYEISIEEEKLAQMKPNMSAIEEFRKKEDAYLEKVAELEKITDSRNEQKNCYEDLRKQRLEEFMNGFGVITNKLKEMYRMITLGGDAELELVDSLDPFSDGIVFSVRPRFKSWKNISNLSGGEKTLSSLALVFALHHYKPTPLYVMDEIDAALDFKNVSIVGNYIKDRTKNAQFIIISLRNNMFELADRLVGIYKTYDCTKSVTIDPRKLCIPSPTLKEPQTERQTHKEPLTEKEPQTHKEPQNDPQTQKDDEVQTKKTPQIETE